mmetsp:Transcript_7570/g.18174  ORF Transcript_7570/g.18174 Transcript_7570/m.18174 type:complete len:246 (+) Transcript_7570:404-1141(+)
MPRGARVPPSLPAVLRTSVLRPTRRPPAPLLRGRRRGGTQVPRGGPGRSTGRESCRGRRRACRAVLVALGCVARLLGVIIRHHDHAHRPWTGRLRPPGVLRRERHMAGVHNIVARIRLRRVAVAERRHRHCSAPLGLLSLSLLECFSSRHFLADRLPALSLGLLLFLLSFFRFFFCLLCSFQTLLFSLFLFFCLMLPLRNPILFSLFLKLAIESVSFLVFTCHPESSCKLVHLTLLTHGNFMCFH